MSYEAIIKTVTAAMVEFDAKLANDTQAWAANRTAALRAYKASEQFKSDSRDHWIVYPKMFDICGGKKWFQVFNGSDRFREEFVSKQCEISAEKRIAKISAALAKAGVKSVVSEEMEVHSDGFNGIFIVETDSGRKTVEIRTIYAGGYNIQCGHIRVLTKVRG